MGALDGKVVLGHRWRHRPGRECALIAAAEGWSTTSAAANAAAPRARPGRPRRWRRRSAPPAGRRRPTPRASATWPRSRACSGGHLRRPAFGDQSGRHPQGHHVPQDARRGLGRRHRRPPARLRHLAAPPPSNFRNQNEGSKPFILDLNRSATSARPTTRRPSSAIMGLSRVLAMEGSPGTCVYDHRPHRLDLIATIPIKDEAAAARMQAMLKALRSTAQPACWRSPSPPRLAKDVTGQIFGAVGDAGGAVQPAAPGGDHHRGRHLDRLDHPERSAAEDGAEVHLARRRRRPTTAAGAAERLARTAPARPTTTRQRPRRRRK